MLVEMSKQFEQYVNPTSTFWTWIRPHLEAENGGSTHMLNFDRFKNKGVRVKTTRFMSALDAIVEHTPHMMTELAGMLFMGIMMSEVKSVSDFADLESQLKLTEQQQQRFRNMEPLSDFLIFETRKPASSEDVPLSALAPESKSKPLKRKVPAPKSDEADEKLGKPKVKAKKGPVLDSSISISSGSSSKDDVSKSSFSSKDIPESCSKDIPKSSSSSSKDIPKSSSSSSKADVGEKSDQSIVQNISKQTAKNTFNNQT
jgi:hypothetical protein